MSPVVSLIPNVTFLRVVRVLRPLRSLTILSEMKIIVNTVLLSFNRLGNVLLMALFLMTIFGILGINFFSGFQYRHCRTQAVPTLSTENGEKCWSLPIDPDKAGRLCGGANMCGEPSDANP